MGCGFLKTINHSQVQWCYRYWYIILVLYFIILYVLYSIVGVYKAWCQLDWWLIDWSIDQLFIEITILYVRTSSDDLPSPVKKSLKGSLDWGWYCTVRRSRGFLLLLSIASSVIKIIAGLRWFFDNWILLLRQSITHKFVYCTSTYHIKFEQTWWNYWHHESVESVVGALLRFELSYVYLRIRFDSIRSKYSCTVRTMVRSP